MTIYYLPPVDEGMGVATFDGVISEYGSWIPNDRDNRDWVLYQIWLSEGNEPQPYPSEGVSG